MSKVELGGHKNQPSKSKFLGKDLHSGYSGSGWELVLKNYEN